MGVVVVKLDLQGLKAVKKVLKRNLLFVLQKALTNPALLIFVQNILRDFVLKWLPNRARMFSSDDATN